MIDLGIDGLAGRRARAGDLADVQQIERQAGELFLDVGMDAIAADEPIGSEDFSHVLDADGGGSRSTTWTVRSAIYCANSLTRPRTSSR